MKVAQTAAASQLHLFSWWFILCRRQYPNHTASDSRMTDKLEGIWKEVVMVCSL
jgi:hypothetical protein